MELLLRAHTRYDAVPEDWLMARIYLLLPQATPSLYVLSPARNGCTIMASIQTSEVGPPFAMLETITSKSMIFVGIN